MDFGNGWAVEEGHCSPVTATPNPCREGSELHLESNNGNGLRLK